MDEGSIWESAMSAAHYKLDNLTAIVDRNNLQIDGSTKEVMSLEPLLEKWQAFGWHTLWPPGNAFCIFFGLTPASQGDEIRPASPVSIFGKIIGDPKAFKKVSSGAKITIEKGE